MGADLPELVATVECLEDAVADLRKVVDSYSKVIELMRASIKMMELRADAHSESIHLHGNQLQELVFKQALETIGKKDVEAG